MNNGITWDYKDQVLVANTASDFVSVYKLDIQAPREKRLQRQEIIKITNHADNIRYDIYLKQYTIGGMGKIFKVTYIIYFDNI